MESGPGDPLASPAARILAEFLTGPDPASEERFESLCAAHPAESERLRRLYDCWQRVEERALGLDVGETLVELMSRVETTDSLAPREARSTRAFADDLIARLSGRGGFERYRIEEQMAEGGQGQILRVHDADLRRTLAMKVSRPDRGGDGKMLARFLDEAQVTGQLDHPGIVPVHEIGLDPKGRVYFTMRFVQGRDLRSVFELVAEGREGWSLTRALGVLLRVCEAMAFAHSKGVVHRDLKPANVMVGDFGEVYVMDWGLAKLEGREDHCDLRVLDAEEERLVRTSRQDVARGLADESGLATMDGDVVGTPFYMPPEQALGQLYRIGPWSDVYCVGAMLYQLLSGHIPYCRPGERKPAAHEVLVRVMQEPPAPLHEIASEVPPGLQAICEKAMAREPEDRYIDMGALAADLQAWLDGRVVLAYQTGALAEFRSWVRRNRPTAAAIASTIALAVGGLGILGMTQASRRAELQVKNAEIERARVLAEQAAGASRVAAAQAREAANAAEWQAYLANVTAADMSRERGNTGDLRRHLESCPEALRGWEWSWLALHGDSSVALLRGHEAPVLDLAGSPDGTLLASGSADRSVRLWDTATALCLARWDGLSGIVRAVGFDRSGTRIAAATQSGELVVWDACSEEEVARVQGGWQGHRSLALSPDLEWLASGSMEDGRVYLWETRSGALARCFDGVETRVACLDISPDGRLVAAGSGFDLRFPQEARVWDRASGALVAAAGGLGTEAVHALAFTADSRSLLVAQDELLTLDLDGSGSVRPVGVHEPTLVAASPRSPGLAVGAGEAEIDLWNGPEPTDSVPLRGHQSEVQSLCFGPRGGWVAAGATDGSIRIWDAEAGADASLGLGGHHGTVTAVAYGPAGQRFASAGEGHRVLIRDARTGLVQTAIEDAGGAPTALAFGLGGELLAGAFADGRTVVWETGSGRTRFELSGHGPGRRSLSVAPGGRLLASASTGQRGWRRTAEGGLEPYGQWDEVVRVWDLERGACVATLDGHDSGAHALAFDPSGHTLITASATRLRSFDTRDFRLQREQPSPDESIVGLSFSPEGGRFACATSQGDVILCAVASLEPVHVFEGHAAEVTGVAFVPGGNRLVSVALDGSLKIWDTVRGAPVATLSAGDPRPDTLAVSPDGARLVTGGDGGLVRLWETDPAAVGEIWRARLQQRAIAAYVDEAFTRNLWEARVLPAVEADPSLGESARRAARGLVLERGDAPLESVEAGVFQVLLDPLAPRSSQELARAHVIELRQRDPENPKLAYGLALAQLRTSRFTEAEATLAEIDASVRAATGTPDPTASAILALVQHEQGRAEEALRLLAETRSRIGADAPELARRVLAEAERSIAGH